MGDYGNAMIRNPDAGMQSRTKGQHRANALHLKLIGQSHPTGLTSNLLKLFEPRPPLEYKPPIEKPELPSYTGIAQFAEHGDPEYVHPFSKGETRAAKKARICQLKLEQGAAKVSEELQKYDPQSDPNATGDPYKTLFVARLNYEISEHRIKKEFEAYGPIKRVRLVTDKETKKPQRICICRICPHSGHEKDAYKQADGRKLDDKRVLVDVERGRTVPNWRPRRLGGGVGSSRIGGEGDHKRAAREQQLVGRSRSEEPRRDDHDADRNWEKSRKRVRERDQDERTCEHSHYLKRDCESREERHRHRDCDRTLDKDQERDRKRDRGRDRDRDRSHYDRYKHRDHGHDYDRGERERERSHNRHRDRGRDYGKDYEHAGHRDRGHLHEKGAYGNGGPRLVRNMAGYDQDYGYNEQRKSHAYGYGQDRLGHETEHSKRHEHGYNREDPYSNMADSYQAGPISTEPGAPEEGEAYEKGDYNFTEL